MANCRNVSLESTAKFLKENDNYIIITHSSPDGDTLGSAFALKAILAQIGKESVVICGDEVPGKYDYLGEVFKGEINPCEKTILAVDVADTALLSGKTAELKERIALCIDHHSTNIQYAETLLLDKDASATAEVIFSIAKCLGVKIDKKTATALYTGICTDTGCFKFSNTTPKTHIFAAELMTLGADYEFVNRHFFETKSKGRLFLEGKAYENLRFYQDGLIALTVLDFETINSASSDLSELDGVAAIPRTIEGVGIGITLKEKEKGKFKISVRTHPPYNAAEICARLGGGGHIRAAGCSAEGGQAEAIEKIVASAEKEILRNGE